MAAKSNLIQEKHIFTNENLKSELCFEGNHGEVVLFSHGNIKNHNSNEDSAAVIHLNANHTILMVADGLGGHAEGAKASKYVVETLCEDLTKNSSANIQETINQSLERSNELICRWKNNAGTTIAIAEILDNKIRTYHAGDSEILICGAKGKICLRTTAHSPVGYSIESGQLSEEDAMLHPDRHYISNYLGHRTMHICTSQFKKIKPRDTLILATDGLFDNLTKSEVINTIRTGQLKNSASHLIEQAHTKMTDFENHIVSKPDDMTFILFRLSRST